MVNTFGWDTLNIEVDGIGPKRIALIAHAWKEQREVREIMIFLQGHRVGAAYAAKIYKHYGNRSIEVVKQNPSRLAPDIFGIGFITADKIPQHLGIDSNSLIRAKAGLLYLLREVAEEGYVYYPENDLIYKAGGILKIDQKIISEAIAVLSQEKEIFLENTPKGEDLKGVYFTSFYKAETGIAERLRRLSDISWRCWPASLGRLGKCLKGYH